MRELNAMIRMIKTPLGLITTENLQNSVSYIATHGVRAFIRKVREVVSRQMSETQPGAIVDEQGSSGRGEEVSATSTPLWIQVRNDISERYIRGKGIEIGAHHAPVRVSEGVTVKYVDILPAEENQRRFPDLTAIPVDIIDDGEVLSSVEEESQDFIIANHFLEHCVNPLGTIRTHLSKLRENGILYYAVPNKELTFDKERPLTAFAHFIEDDLSETETSRYEHYVEWVRYVEKPEGGDAIESRAKQIMADDFRIHFHTWDAETYRNFLEEARKYLDCTFAIECVIQNGIEMISVLSKTTGDTLSADRRSEDPSRLRYRIAAPYLSGKGIEIGAGANPHPLPPGAVCEHFDKRTRKELAELFNIDESAIRQVHSLEVFGERFPEKAEFLIAHHVLEHLSNPIGALAEWNSYVKDGGVVVLSVPDADFCPDRGRLSPSFEHILLDYLFHRDDDSFESREHIYSFVMGWIDDGFAQGLDKREIAERTHTCAKAPQNDLHWHCFSEDMLRKIITAAAFFGNREITINATASPYRTDGEWKTDGEVIYVYGIRKNRGNNMMTALDGQVLEELRRVQDKLLKALKRVDIILPR